VPEAGTNSAPEAAAAPAPEAGSAPAAEAGTTPAGSAGPEAGEAPVAASPPPPAPGAGDDGDTTTIASTRGPAPAPGSAAAAGDDNGGESGNAENGAPAGNSEEGAAPAAEANNTETGNPKARPHENAAAPAGNEEGDATAAAAPARGGEEVASAPPATVPENAPAATPPQWPQDLSQELQSPSNAKGGAGRLYRSGLDAMKSRDYSAAVDRFTMIQKKYPHSDLTEPAAYFSATALNEMGKYDQAILQYNDLVMRYPKGKYSSEALLREGQAFMQINDKIDARLTLQKLVNEHGGTPQAAEASAMLKNLESN
jgi:tol-pal system protein YbgF